MKLHFDNLKKIDGVDVGGRNQRNQIWIKKLLLTPIERKQLIKWYFHIFYPELTSQKIFSATCAFWKKYDKCGISTTSIEWGDLINEEEKILYRVWLLRAGDVGFIIEADTMNMVAHLSQWAFIYEKIDEKLYKGFKKALLEAKKEYPESALENYLF